MNSLIKEFVNGSLAVFADKANPNEIIRFYRLVEPYTKGFNSPYDPSEDVLRYLLNGHSGPYHFIRYNEFDGSPRSYVEKHNYKIITAEEFMDIVEYKEFKIQEEELIEMFN